MANPIDVEYLKKVIANEPSIEPNLEKAWKFYQKHILEADQDLVPLLDDYNFKNVLPEWKWEVLAAILVGDKSRKGTIERHLAKNPENTQKGGKGNSKNGNGPDLLKHEVKARMDGMGFEYQYHKNSWKEKLREEPKIVHVYISYWPNYTDFDLRIVHGSKLNDLFQEWEKEITEKFQNKTFEGRCRPAIPYKTAVSRASLILSVRNVEITFQNLDLLKAESIGITSEITTSKI